MDMSRRGTWTGLLAAAVLLASAPSGRAQERTMRFRPVPPESAARFEEQNRTEAREPLESQVEPDTTEESAPEGIPAVPPTPPPPPEKSETRSTRGDIVRFGSDITVREGQTIEGDVQTFGGSIEVLGHVTGDVFVIGGDLTLASTARVDGDVVCFGGTLHEEPGSSVGGKRVTSPRSRVARIFWPVRNVFHTGYRVFG